MVLVWITEGAQIYSACVTAKEAAEKGYPRQVLEGLSS